MAERKPKWREAGNLTIVNIQKVAACGAYIEFYESNKYILDANKVCEQGIFRREE